MQTSLKVPEVVRRAGWCWTTAGLQVSITTPQGTRLLLFPIGHLELIFDRAMAKEGIHMPYGVGDAGSVGGLFRRICASGRPLKRHSERKQFFRGLGQAERSVKLKTRSVQAHPSLNSSPELNDAASQVVKRIEEGKEAVQLISTGQGGDGSRRHHLESVAIEGARSKQALRKMAELAGRGDARAAEAMTAFACILGMANL